MDPNAGFEIFGAALTFIPALYVGLLIGKQILIKQVLPGKWGKYP